MSQTVRISVHQTLLVRTMKLIPPGGTTVMFHQVLESLFIVPPDGITQHHVVNPAKGDRCHVHHSVLETYTFWSTICGYHIFKPTSNIGHKSVVVRKGNN